MPTNSSHSLNDENSKYDWKNVLPIVSIQKYAYCSDLGAVFLMRTGLKIDNK